MAHHCTIGISLLLLQIFHASVPCKPSYTNFIWPHTNSSQPSQSSNNTVAEFKGCPVDPKCVCGTQRGNFLRISGGETARRYEFPWQAALVYRNTRMPFCGGSLINNLYVLTAAHCAIDMEKITPENANTTQQSSSGSLWRNPGFQVLLNAYQLTPLSVFTLHELYTRIRYDWWYLDYNTAIADIVEGSLRLDVTEILFHPEFVRSYQNGRFDYDIALLRVSVPLNLTAPGAPVPVCLPAADTGALKRYKNVTDAIVTGWGLKNYQDFTSGSPLLQKLRVPVYSLKKCRRVSGIDVSRRFVCAGYFNKSRDIGKSDSGGPLVVMEDGTFVQIGVVSWASGEVDGEVATAFTRVSEFIAWIQETILNDSSDQKMSSSCNNKVKWCRRSIGGVLRTA